MRFERRLIIVQLPSNDCIAIHLSIITCHTLLIRARWPDVEMITDDAIEELNVGSFGSGVVKLVIDGCRFLVDFVRLQILNQVVDFLLIPYLGQQMSLIA